MKLYDHQKRASKQLRKKLSKHGFVIFAAQERFGKTLSFIDVAERGYSHILIVTKKAAISSIQEQMKALGTTKRYDIINYESLHKLPNANYDLVVLDEFHQAVCSYPKPSATYKKLLPICKDAEVMLVSATPFPETMSQSFHPLKLGKYPLWDNYPNFYDWFKQFGIVNTMFIHGRQIKQYHETKPVNLTKYMVTGTREEAGFKHEPVDKMHTIKLKKRTKKDIKTYKEDKVIDEIYPLDSAMAEMNAVYARSGGAVITEDGVIWKSTEKIDYVTDNFDPTNTAIMCHYKHEQSRLAELFPHVYSSTSHAEGVDLSHFKNLVIYSMSFSTSKFSQRRARQANIKRDSPIIVHFLIADAGLDRHVYDMVAVKNKNFTMRTYRDARE